MKTLLLLAFLSIANLARADAPAASALDWLLGGTWVAPLPPKKDGSSSQIELKCARPESGHGVRFDSFFVTGGKAVPYTSGMYAWNAAHKKFAIFYTDSSGSLNAGEVAPEGNVFAHDYTATDGAGAVEPIRVRLTHESPDVFTNDISVLKDGAWVQVVKVRYERRS